MKIHFTDTRTNVWAVFYINRQEIQGFGHDTWAELTPLSGILKRLIREMKRLTTLGKLSNSIQYQGSMIWKRYKIYVFVRQNQQVLDNQKIRTDVKIR